MLSVPGHPMSIGISKRWFAWAMCHLARRYDALLADRKRDLLGSLDGTVLEIGPGTGTNFRYYRRGVRWIGVEPNPVRSKNSICMKLRTMAAEGEVAQTAA
jgi:hypothetical protein